MTLHLPQQTRLALDSVREMSSIGPGRREQDYVEKHLGFLSAGVAAILESLPLPRKPFSDSTKALYVRIVLERRNGRCPCCQDAVICTTDGKLPSAQFDHWYGRHRNAPDDGWICCAPCNASLEDPHFKAAVRSQFYAFQACVLAYMATAQRDLFE